MYVCKQTLRKLYGFLILRILRIKTAKFSWYFYVNNNIQGDFQICISVPLTVFHVRFEAHVKI